MKLTAIILLTTCLQVSANGYAQTPVTLNEKSASLKSIFEKISRQTGIIFWYRSDLLDKGKPVSIQVENAPLQETLDKIFIQQPFSFTIKDKDVFVKIKDDVVIKMEVQAIEVRGRVVNEQGSPIEGVTVRVKGHDKATITNAKGEFSISDVEVNDVLIFSHISMEGFEVKVHGGADLAITLKSKVSALDEVQMIGYGTSTRRFNTGNVTTVKSSEIERQPISNPILALQGRVPGLTVTQSTGVSGGAVTIRVQGRNNLNSFFTGSDPLIIVDGVPYPSQNLLTLQTGSNSSTSNVLGPVTGDFNTAGSTLSFINPEDIESIDVLKDADATAIYGSRAANGAILITTKKGKAGETKLDVNFQTGWGNVAHKMDLLNSEQYLEMRHEAKRNDNAATLATDYDLNGLWDTTRYTDWQKEMIGNTSTFTRATATVSGGQLNTKYLIGGTYSKETTVFPGDFGNTRGSVHFNISSSTSGNRFQVQLTGSFLTDNNNVPGIDFTRFIALAPVAPALFNADGTLNWAPTASGTSSWDNPLSYNYNMFENKTKNLTSNAILNYRLLPGLEIKTSLGYNQLQTTQFLTSLDASFRPERRATRIRNANFVNNNTQTWIAEPQITYTRNFKGPGKLDVLVGATFQETNNDGMLTFGSGQSSDDLLKNLAAATSISASTINSVYRYNAIFGRLNYIFRNRYLINLSARRDGSSRFGAKNLFHDFGAIGAGWIFSEESLVRKNIPFLSYGKLRASYGVMGNDQIGDYNYMSLFQSTQNLIPYQTIRGLEPTGISNPYLQWEETRKLQVGLELGFFVDRILLSTNYFCNRSSNTLSDIALPLTTGIGSFLDNFGALIQNSGWEFTLRTENIKGKDFTWTTSFNLTIPRNKLVDFPGLETSSSADLLIVGKPLDIFKTYSYNSIDPQTGRFLLTDSTGKTTSSPDYQKDRISVLNQAVNYYGGLENTISYKGFQLDFLFQFTKQKGWNFLNFGGLPGRFNSLVVLGNQPETVLDRWQKPGDITNTPRYKSTSGDFITGDWAFRDASFIRLKNISLSYKFPKRLYKKAGLKDANVFVNGQNVITFTKYKGLDPETRSIITLPPLRVITIGIKLSL